jgi:hypothetical protein
VFKFFFGRASERALVIASVKPSSKKPAAVPFLEALDVLVADVAGFGGDLGSLAKSSSLDVFSGGPISKICLLLAD